MFSAEEAVLSISSLCILDINPFIRYITCNYCNDLQLYFPILFFPILQDASVVSFDVQKLWSLELSHLSIFFFLLCYLCFWRVVWFNQATNVIYLQKGLPTPIHPPLPLSRLLVKCWKEGNPVSSIVVNMCVSFWNYSLMDVILVSKFLFLDYYWT